MRNENYEEFEGVIFVSIASHPIMSIIKDSSLITGHTEEKNKQEITIKRYKSSKQITRLSDVLHQIPHGLVAKDETGMGATHLELITKRNSIIVEPIKVTASSKAKQHESSLYIGSPTRYSPSATNKRIAEYCSDPSIPFKKILVVADSLPRLVKVLGETIYENYFLMIDEIDSFQTDASFRGKMEVCIDIYKRFPADKRSLVSATVISFSDPILEKEHQTILKYDISTQRTILLLITNQVEFVAIEEITKTLKADMDGKIMIAYNSVTGCRTIADKLVSDGLLAKEDIKILCSVNSKQEVDDYYSDLLDDTLPAKVNFFTSAYFSGFDLNERYHLISLSDNKNKIHALSEKKLQQIAGRCRKELLSETIIFDTAPFYETSDSIGLKELFAAAQKELDALKCIEKNYASNALLKNNLNTIRSLIVKHTERDGHQYIRSRFPDDEHVISYLNIDAYLENIRVRELLYTDAMSLFYKLKEQGHTVKISNADTLDTLEEKSTAKLIREELVKKAIQMIATMANADLKLALKSKETASIQKTIIRAYLDNCEYIDKKQLLKHLEKGGAQRDSRYINNFLWAAFYESLDEKQHYKRLVRYHIPLTSTFTSADLLEKWNQIFAESGLHEVLKSQIKAVRLTKIHFKVKKNRLTRAFSLVSDNPLKLTVIQTRGTVKNEKDFANLYHTKVGR